MPETVSGVPPSAPPSRGDSQDLEGITSVTTRQAENSELAVPVTTRPGSSMTGSTTEKLASPWASVWTSSSQSESRPRRNPSRRTPSWQRAQNYVPSGELLSVPKIVVDP